MTSTFQIAQSPRLAYKCFCCTVHKTIGFFSFVISFSNTYTLSPAAAKRPPLLKIAVIPRLSKALAAILYRARRAVTDDIVQRTQPRAFAAANAFIVGAEFIRFHEKRVERRIHGGAHKAVIEIVPRRGKLEALGADFD